MAGLAFGRQGMHQSAARQAAANGSAEDGRGRHGHPCHDDRGDVRLRTPNAVSLLTARRRPGTRDQEAQVARPSPLSTFPFAQHPALVEGDSCRDAPGASSTLDFCQHRPTQGQLGDTRFAQKLHWLERLDTGNIPPIATCADSPRTVPVTGRLAKATSHG